MPFFLCIFIDAYSFLFHTFFTEPNELFNIKKDIVNITIATNYMNITNHLASKIFYIEQTYPLKISPSFIEYDTNEEIINSIKDGLADIAFCAFFIDSSKKFEDIYKNTDSNLEFTHAVTFNIYCELHKQHPLSYLQQIPLNKLKKYSLRYFFPRKNSSDINSIDVSQYSFSKFFRQFDYTFESNLAFYNHAIQYDNSIGLTIGIPNTLPPEHCIRPLQAPYKIEIIAFRKILFSSRTCIVFVI